MILKTIKDQLFIVHICVDLFLSTVRGWAWTRNTAYPVQCHLNTRNWQVSELSCA